ncbi:hypothetical protein FHS80_001117 [Porphyromonas circumdentaria]|nr:hypothetical protein [Porphyromonas circumdentaria]
MALFVGFMLVTSCKKEPISQPIVEKVPSDDKKENPKEEEQKPEEEETPKEEEEQPKEEDESNLFPTPDNSIELKGAPAERLLTLLFKRDFDRILALGETQISHNQLAEIKSFADQLIEKNNAQTQKEKHNLLFKWIVSHVKYGSPSDASLPDYNSAYTTYKYGSAICQGYSNLLKVMCYTQGIIAPVVNGFANFNTLGNPLGHAWNYVFLDNTWYVSDATNNIFYKADEKEKFNFLLPEHIDFVLWKDEQMEYVYQNKELTVGSIRNNVSSSRLTVPYSIGGIRISNFNPQSLPSTIKEIYLGSNIKYLGVADNRKLKDVGGHLEKIAIDPQNEYLENYYGSIYEKGDTQNIPILIPAQLKVIKLKPIPTVGKNIIYGHQGARELYFQEGTEVIEEYAIDSCPNLEKIYLPKSIKKVGEKAFWLCHPNLKVIYF